MNEKELIFDVICSCISLFTVSNSNLTVIYSDVNYLSKTVSSEVLRIIHEVTKQDFKVEMHSNSSKFCVIFFRLLDKISL